MAMATRTTMRRGSLATVLMRAIRSRHIRTSIEMDVLMKTEMVPLILIHQELMARFGR